MFPYLGSDDAEAHAIVLLQRHRHDFRFLPHWLRKEQTVELELKRQEQEQDCELPWSRGWFCTRLAELRKRRKRRWRQGEAHSGGCSSEPGLTTRRNGGFWR